MTHFPHAQKPNLEPMPEARPWRLHRAPTGFDDAAPAIPCRAFAPWFALAFEVTAGGLQCLCGLDHFLLPLGGPFQTCTGTRGPVNN